MFGKITKNLNGIIDNVASKLNLDACDLKKEISKTSKAIEKDFSKLNGGKKKEAEGFFADFKKEVSNLGDDLESAFSKVKKGSKDIAHELGATGKAAKALSGQMSVWEHIEFFIERKTDKYLKGKSTATDKLLKKN